MPVLAIDTSAAACSVAVMADGKVLAWHERPMERGQAEALMGMIDDVLEDAGLGYAHLNRIGVTVGPGSFTGLRVGLSAARGLALSLNIPAFGIGSLEALAASVDDREKGLLVAMDTRRGDYYVQLFYKARPLAPPALATADGLPKIKGLAPGLLVAGDVAKEVAVTLAAAGFEATSLDRRFADPRAVARLTAALPLSAAAAPPVPVYLRPPEAKIPEGGGRLRP